MLYFHKESEETNNQSMFINKIQGCREERKKVSNVCADDFPAVNLELWSVWFQHPLKLLFPELTESVF